MPPLPTGATPGVSFELIRGSRDIPGFLGVVLEPKLMGSAVVLGGAQAVHRKQWGAAKRGGDFRGALSAPERAPQTRR